MNIDYKKAYNIYKKMPLISFVSTVVLALAWGILDAVEFITGIGELEFGAVVVWLLIGAVFAFIPAFLTSIIISPTVLRTDAALAVQNSIAANPSSHASVAVDELPEL